MQKGYELRCYLCQRIHLETESVTTCVDCSGPLETYYDYDQIEKKLNVYALKTAPISAMKYVAFYPIEDFTNIISLSEGGTPLIKAKNLAKKLGLKNIYLKNEGLNPTGCFKDRGTMVEVTKAKELNAKAICLASTGNMAASVAAYASAAGIPCYVLVPEGTAIGKLAQSLTFGARVIQVRADYSRCAELAEQMAKRFGYYLAGDYTFRTEGQKSEGYEIIEQLYWQPPDYVLCPVGVGTNFHAIAKGIQELYNFGFIKKMPKFIAVQTPGCSPIVKSFKQKRFDYDIVENPQTIAAAMCVGNPLDGPKILKDIYDTNGYAVEVTDEEILQAQQEQARLEGVYAEPTGAMAYAAVKKLSAENFFNESDTIVCMVTGNGMKDPKSPLTIIAEPATIEADFSELERFIEQKLFAIREGNVNDKVKMIFDRPPTSVEDIQIVLSREFDIQVNNTIAVEVFETVIRFIEKGKVVKRSDLQHILETVLSEFSVKNRVFSITDFKINTSLHDRAEAQIWAKWKDQEIVATHSGVGPVDAAITAIKSELPVFIALTDYEVSIDSSGVDSAVEVKMSLVDDKNNKIVAKATSPDIIVASIRAFEKGVNILYGNNK